MKNIKVVLRFSALVICIVIFQACASRQGEETGSHVTTTAYAQLADEMESSLFDYLINCWYPLIIDTLHGGYTSDYNRDWSPSAGPQMKAIVQQARHVWSTAYIYEHYPDKKEFLEYSAHGFRFLRDAMWDQEFGGFHAYVTKEGAPSERGINDKRIYGQAFAVYGLSQYYRMSKNQEALQLAKEAFLWMEENAHDPRYGGYFEFLLRDGSPARRDDDPTGGIADSPAIGLKDYNSSIHLMEAFTELYRCWPDSLVRARLEEMFYLIRDTFVHPEGYLQLFFYPDWTLVPEATLEESALGDQWYTQHFTYGHDVETAFLLLETAHVLGWDEDKKTHLIAKRLVDHSLESGWDQSAGGFFDAGKRVEGDIRIINNHKAWWGQVEGLNALLMMHQLYPDDKSNYYDKFLKSWEHIDTYLIDKEFGGWYNHALDTDPDSKNQRKGHIWKTSYHNTRGMINCIKMLRGEIETERSRKH